jgi:L,D-transpeptidase catalytic domain
MASGMDRRELLKGGIAASAALALAVPAKASAQLVPGSPIQADPYQRRLLDTAAQQVARFSANLWRTDLVGIADFGMASSEPRFHLVNLEAGTVRSLYVAHGRGSDPEHDGWLKTFSNVSGSEATSRGGYLTCEWYTGKYGTSIRLVGLEEDNSQALDRAIVVHPAWYADPAMIGKWGKLGRSEGCFAMAPGEFSEALLRLSGGRLIFSDRIGMG